MAVGDSDDILARVRGLIPFRWFKIAAPIRDAVLGGLSDMAAWCYRWIVYVRAQSRIKSAFGPMLDIIARDFFGRNLQRKGAADDNLKSRILSTILQERVTRGGMERALTALTGVAPAIVEPFNPRDCGAYGQKITGYGRAGAYGSLQLPFQCFMTVKGTGVHVPNTSGFGAGLGGYGVGAIEYSGASLDKGAITDADVYETIRMTKPTAAICWTRIL